MESGLACWVPPLSGRDRSLYYFVALSQGPEIQRPKPIQIPLYAASDINSIKGYINPDKDNKVSGGKEQWECNHDAPWSPIAKITVTQGSTQSSFAFLLLRSTCSELGNI